MRTSASASIPRLFTAACACLLASACGGDSPPDDTGLTGLLGSVTTSGGPAATTSPTAPVGGDGGVGSDVDGTTGGAAATTGGSGGPVLATGGTSTTGATGDAGTTGVTGDAGATGGEATTDDAGTTDDTDGGASDTDSGTPDAGSDDDDMDEENGDKALGGRLCELEPSQVVVLGDSYVALDPSFVLLDQHPFTSNLEALAREAGALEEGEEYRDHALSGASMAYAPAIPQQLEDAIAADDDIKLVIMTGGGNDILVNNRLCLEYETEAELLQDDVCVGVVDAALEEGQKMFDRGVEVGAEAVIYFFYPRLPGAEGGGIGAGTYPNTMLDYAYPRVQELCESQTEAQCFFVDMRGPFDSDGDGSSDPGLVNLDGIHPTYEGSEILADEVWKVMQRRCLASE